MSHDVITQSISGYRYQLLKCICRYQILQIYLSFDIYINSSISVLKNALVDWEKEIKVSHWNAQLHKVCLTSPFQVLGEMDSGSKDWNFIKNHSHKHAVDDIIQKGVTMNYNTKPFERMHGALKQIYHWQTNFKDVAKQVIL